MGEFKRCTRPIPRPQGLMPTSARLRGFRLVGFTASAGGTPSGGLFFPLVRKEEEERHAKGKGFLQSRPSLWNPILRGLFASRALRCRARCLAPLGPRNRGAAGNVGGGPAQRISLWIRGNNPICHSSLRSESCGKFAPDSSSLTLLRMTDGKDARIPARRGVHRGRCLHRPAYTVFGLLVF